MNLNNSNKYVFPVAAFILVALAFILHFSFDNKADSLSPFRKSVENNLQDKLGQVNREALAIESRFKVDSLDFDDFTDIRGIFFLYRYGNPLYWSTNEILPDYYRLPRTDSLQYITLGAGHYVYQKYRLSESDELVSLIELYQETRINNDYLRSHYNEEIFPSQEGFIISNETGEVVTVEGRQLFFLQDQSLQYPPYKVKSFLVLLFVTLSLVLLGIWVWKYLALRVKTGEFESSFFGWVSFLFFIRYLMLVLDIPDSIMETGLFASMLFAASRINPSLGDMLINGLVLMLIALFLFNFYTRSNTLRKVLKSPSPIKWFGAVFSLLFALFATWYPHVVIQTIYYNSQVTMDITQSISFGFPRVISLLIFVVSAFSLFLVLYVVNRILFQIFRNSYWQMLLVYVIAIALFSFYQIYTSQHFWVVIISSFLFTHILYFSRIYKTFMQWGYQSFIYIFSILALTSFLGSFGIYEFEIERVTSNKVRFADYFLVKNDNITEYYLKDLSERVENDAFISSRLGSPFLSKDIIEGKIRKVYLGSLFDKYDVSVSIFGSDGQILHGSPSNEELMLVNGDGDKLQTTSEYNSIYFINRVQGDLTKRYLTMSTIKRRDITVGYITFDLEMKKIIPNDVYFELLLDDRFIQPYLGQDYSYAVYSGERLIYNSGDFNYLGDFSTNLFSSNPEIFENGYQHGNFRHIAMEDEENRTIVVSSESYKFERFISNFSFLFLVQIFLLLVFGIAYSIFLFYKGVQLNYTSRIQLYFNLGFFVPLLTVSLVTMSIMNSTFRNEVKYENEERSKKIASNIAEPLDDFINGYRNDEELNDELLLASKFVGTDVNLFDTYGKLVVSSKPLIFENELTSRFLNPEAYAALIERNEQEFLTEENIGTMTYNVSYLAIKSFSTGDLIGILGVPFFDSEIHLESSQIEVITTIINIFTIVFIVFLIISYFVSKGLTFPLRLITQKLRKTTLTQFNEPLTWESDDEIGLMVGEYNRMLDNLEESKRELAKSQKESAWREMAQQVAHEIKNPLTPMKLTLQHLERKINQPGQDVEKPLQTLLHHVETLNDIASSFSSIATMPIPENEPFELVDLVKKTIELHQTMEGVEITSDFDTDSVTVLGDEQLMGRILSNIILNAVQSTDNGENVNIHVSLKTNTRKVQVEIRDNGQGIEEKFRNKVFIPNFTTKESGSGIGLAIAKHGIEHAGGKIWFETEQGKGTSFYIELPVQ